MFGSEIPCGASTKRVGASPRSPPRWEAGGGWYTGSYPPLLGLVLLLLLLSLLLLFLFLLLLFLLLLCIENEPLLLLLPLLLLVAVVVRVVGVVVVATTSLSRHLCASLDCLCEKRMGGG